MDEMTTTIQTTTEQLTETAANPETVTEIITEIVEVLPTLEANPQNEMHKLYSLLGCNLDHVPINEYEAFTMALQFIGATVFLIMFCRALFKLMCHGLRGGL